ncbi:MICAL-like protein 1 isoform X1 [Athalia rosae]|uniref:MICAL-like protein 1 isoform X1 n=2 Tax=Athalia rosae TaxID=37344 RepID=UPI002033C72E|nr:MICAL-like protein 1 isoform X1 [Athalia rosae]XP_020712215.2 MICAL-like protein 1 isoform X1 [Athalia rosae]XP_020712216.2 MICAL-like protein 1 isoform X1 [Athalia rosae]XP_020712217.2 MICAL-like protein 1 isoform X1 [Athalia rosae]
MGERRGTKALELWCRRITQGYPGVNVQNMTTSWRDGLAFCAMIHHFRPELVDFNGLNKDDVYGNNELAFRTAEQHLGIPALLDAEDMASCAVPDRLSILTYLSQFYQTFGALSPSRPAVKRTKEETDGRLASVSGSPQPKVGVRLGMRKEPCVVCGLPVFLAERLVISRSLYHRTCFRCARCNNQLTLGNYYETEEGQFCCETCPDEELASSIPVMHQDYNQIALIGGSKNAGEVYPAPYERALSDEEKTSKHTNFDVAGDSTRLTPPPDENPSPSLESKTRLNFITSHLLSDNRESEIPPANERLLPPAAENEESPHPVDKRNETPDESSHASADTSLSSFPAFPTSSSINSAASLTLPSARPVESQRSDDSSDEDDLHSGTETETVSKHEDDGVNNDKYSSKIVISSSVNQHPTAIATHDVDNRSIRFNEDTKDAVAADKDKAYEAPGERLSLVQQRLKIFENSIHAEEAGKANEPNSVVHNLSKQNMNKDEPKKEDERTDRVTGESIDDVEVVHEWEEPSHLPGEEPLTAAVTSKKKTEGQELPADAPSQAQSLSNISGVDLSDAVDYPEDLNPFQSDDSDGHDGEEFRQPPINDKSDKNSSTNPFGSSEEEDGCKEVAPPRPAVRNKTASRNKTDKDIRGTQLQTKRILKAPQISLNPFWSDEDDHDSDDDTKTTPIPKPRTLKPTPEPSPVPRKTSLDRSGLYASNSSIASTGSLVTPGGTHRKKKPAPPPPMAQDMFSSSSAFASPILQSGDELSLSNVAASRTPRIRKSKPAPPPPMSTSTPHSTTDSFVTESENPEVGALVWDDQKSSKDEINRNRQSLSPISNAEEGVPHYSVSFVDKSAQGKWKRKKGPAPPRPIPHKRKIKVMSVKDVKLELDEIEMQQQGLEKQGVRLEQLIRDKCETGQESEEFTSLRVDVEELVLELFALVNEKNELFRRQAELMLLRRQQRLEEEHADVEYQIRCLMSQPEATKTDSDKQREEVLIQRLVEIVERRNEIVECLEMDRRREVEEDRSIHEQMGIYAAKSKGDLTSTSDSSRSLPTSKKNKVKEKVKDKKNKKSHKKDADKDVDETETKLKRHKKKWF